MYSHQIKYYYVETTLRTRNRLLVTRSLLRDTENVKHSKHFKNLSICVRMEKKGRATAQASHGKIEQRKEV